MISEALEGASFCIELSHFWAFWTLMKDNAKRDLSCALLTALGFSDGELLSVQHFFFFFF